MQLVEKYKPTTIEGFAGMDRVKKIITAFIQKPYPSAWLFLGPSGTGKTTLAFTVAEAVGASPAVGGGIYHIPARKCDLETIDTITHECRHRPMLGGPFNVLIIDEADQMTMAAQVALLSKLDSADPLPDTIVIMTANGVDRLEERFLSRCRKLAFNTDGLLAPGAALLQRIWKAETKATKPRPPEPDFELIIRSAKFNIREALMLLETELLCPGSVAEPTTNTAKNGIGKGNGAGEVYTIGCEEIPPETMVDVSRALNIHVFLDCCWKAKRPYRAALGEIYQWSGDTLGAGRIAEKQREAGYKKLLDLISAGKNVMLMYKAESPGECYRHPVIAMGLLERGVDVLHVFDEQLIRASEYQASIDEDRDYKFTKWRLLKVVGQ